jgi:hypothetical protein
LGRGFGAERAAGLDIARATRLAVGFFATFFRLAARLARAAGFAARAVLRFALAFAFFPVAMGSLRK